MLRGRVTAASTVRWREILHGVRFRRCEGEGVGVAPDHERMYLPAERHRRLIQRSPWNLAQIFPGDTTPTSRSAASGGYHSQTATVGSAAPVRPASPRYALAIASARVDPMGSVR